MTRVPFTTRAPYDALGRNGYTLQTGVSVFSVGGFDGADRSVFVEPINSRGEVTRCRVVIPRADLPAFITALQAQLPFQPGATVSIPDGSIHTVEDVDGISIYLSNGDRWTAPDLKEIRP